MMFGDVPLDQAEGALLAHSVPAASLAQGTCLEADHIAALRAFGFSSVLAARLQDTDIAQHVAVCALGKALVPDGASQGLRVIDGGDGRIDIMSHLAGLVMLDTARIAAMNAVSPDIAIATLPNAQRVRAGIRVATLAVRPFGVPQSMLERVLGAPASAALPCYIQRAVVKTVTLIETHHPGQRPQPLARRVLDDRVDRLGACLVEVLDIAHDADAIAQAIARAKGEAIFILAASETCHLEDTAPKAVTLSGGHITRFGLPIAPGQGTFWGRAADNRPVIGLPDCARTPAQTGADWVMERILCGLPIRDEDICASGVGGLLGDGRLSGRMGVFDPDQKPRDYQTGRSMINSA